VQRTREWRENPGEMLFCSLKAKKKKKSVGRRKVWARLEKPSQQTGMSAKAGEELNRYEDADGGTA